MIYRNGNNDPKPRPVGVTSMRILTMMREPKTSRSLIRKKSSLSRMKNTISKRFSGEIFSIDENNPYANLFHHFSRFKPRPLSTNQSQLNV